MAGGTRPAAGGYGAPDLTFANFALDLRRIMKREILHLQISRLTLEGESAIICVFTSET